MSSYPDEALAAVGRLTIAATDLEYLLAWIGVGQAGGDATKIFLSPGEPLTAAQGSVEFAPSTYRSAYQQAVTAAGELLAESHGLLRNGWLEHGTENDAIDWAILGRATSVRHPADPAVLDRLTARLIACRDHLAELLEAQLTRQPPE